MPVQRAPFQGAAGALSLSHPAQNRNSRPKSIPWAQKVEPVNKGIGLRGPMANEPDAGKRLGFTATSRMVKNLSRTFSSMKHGRIVCRLPAA